MVSKAEAKQGSVHEVSRPRKAPKGNAAKPDVVCPKCSRITPRIQFHPGFGGCLRCYRRVKSAAKRLLDPGRLAELQRVRYWRDHERNLKRAREYARRKMQDPEWADRIRAQKLAAYHRKKLDPVWMARRREIDRRTKEKQRQRRHAASIA